METRSSSSSLSTVLIVCILLFTFPFWIGVAGGMFGMVMGLLGGLVGVVVGFFGLIIGLIVLPFKLIFGIGHWGWFPHFHFHGIIILALFMLVTALIVKARK